MPKMEKTVTAAKMLVNVSAKLTIVESLFSAKHEEKKKSIDVVTGRLRAPKLKIVTGRSDDGTGCN